MFILLLQCIYIHINSCFSVCIFSSSHRKDTVSLPPYLLLLLSQIVLKEEKSLEFLQRRRFQYKVDPGKGKAKEGIQDQKMGKLHDLAMED